VRVFPSSRLNENPKGENTTNTQNLQENRAHLSALIPLAFGGKKALARLQIFVERKTGATRFKNTPAVYFVFFVRTENQGDLQWSVYLKERQISLQVFAEGKGDEKEELKSLIGKVEKSLKNRGFILLAPTVLLTHPFRIPEGFQMNVRG
jgi:hypothetical protein